MQQSCWSNDSQYERQVPAMMKIQTEVVKGVFIITFAGTRLDSTFAHGFFNAMQENIRKGNMDVVLDLSNIESVNSYELGTMVSSFMEIEGHRQVELCGVNSQVLDLLNKTHMDEIFSHAENRDEAISNLLSGEKKRRVRTVASVDPVVLVEEDWLELIEEVTVEEADDAALNANHERRQHRRIDCFQILDEDIMVRCHNIRTGKHSTGIILNISPGGLYIISTAPLKTGDSFVIQGDIGKIFTLKEQAVIRSGHDGRYGLEFVNPSKKTTQFLNELIGSVNMQTTSGRG